ncbi:hypothetical protein FOCC_FOCC005771 [Frankliniella occidentalis]|nr:hypothetical protein FOCC_FOCC005771 [Frankliniella occidentalis]
MLPSSVADCALVVLLTKIVLACCSRAVVRNPDVRGGQSAWLAFGHDFWGTPLGSAGSHGSYRPLAVLSLRANAYLAGGLRPRAFHLVNAQLHALCSWLVARLSRRLGPPAAWPAAALLFAVHPVHCEAVAGIVGRADLLAAALALLALLAFLRHLDWRERGCRCPAPGPAWCRCRAWAGALLAATLALAAGAMLCKEPGLTVLVVCASYDLALQLGRRQRKPFSLGSLGALAAGGAGLLAARLWLVGLRTPVFARADNPAAHASSWGTRALTFLHLPAVNLRLLLWPGTLSFDWSMDAVERVESLADPRNLQSAALYASLAVLVAKAVSALRAEHQGTERYTARRARTVPKRRQVKPDRKMKICGVCSKLIESRGSSYVYTYNNNVILTNNNNNNNNNNYISSRSSSSSSSGSGGSATERGGEPDVPPPVVPAPAGAALLGLALLVFPLLPASNLFFYVGFVIAERVLYLPSVGFCLLVAQGFAWLADGNRGRRAAGAGAAVGASRRPKAGGGRREAWPGRAPVLVAGVLLLTVFAARTVQRNWDWADEEDLYRAGIAGTERYTARRARTVPKRRQVKPDRKMKICGVCSKLIESRGSSYVYTYNNNVILTNNNNNNNNNNYISSRSSSSSSSGSGGSATERGGEPDVPPPVVPAPAGAALLGLALLVFPLLPASNLFFYVGFVIAERVLYLPSVGFCLLVAQGFAWLADGNRGRRAAGAGAAVGASRRPKAGGGRREAWPGRAPVLVAGVLLLTVFAARTVQRNWDWADEEDLYRAGIAVNPPKAYGNLGSVLSSRGRLSEAEHAFRMALKFRPNMAEVHYNLGNLLLKRDKLEEAIRSYQQAIHYRPSLALAHLHLGHAFAARGQVREAVSALVRCASLRLPSSGRLLQQAVHAVRDEATHEAARVSALLLLGHLHAAQGRLRAAEAAVREAILARPEDYQPEPLYKLLAEVEEKLRVQAEARSRTADPLDHREQAAAHAEDAVKDQPAPPAQEEQQRTAWSWRTRTCNDSNTGHALPGRQQSSGAERAELRLGPAREPPGPPPGPGPEADRGECPMAAAALFPVPASPCA